MNIEPMSETEIICRKILLPHLDAIYKRIDLCEKVFIKITQLDVRLDTLEFNSDLPVKPTAVEKLYDIMLRIERLESYLLNGESQCQNP